MKFDVKFILKNLTSTREFHENMLNDSHFVIRVVNTFYSYLLYILTDMD
jgi:hypothetical protein